MSDRVGYIKVWRKSLDNPVIFKDSDHIAIWFYLLLNAVKFPKDIDFKGKRHTLKSGQFSTGRNVIAKDLKISETKVQRVLKRFESEHQIEQQTSNKCRIITILNWGLYQESEQQIEQQVNNNCTTSEQQVNTKKERKESKERKERNKDIIIMSDIISLLKKSNLPAIRSFTDKRKKHLKARINESKEFQTIEFWEKFVDIINNSDFLSNRIENKGKHKNWKADIDFVLRQDIFNKILEGKYSNSQNNDVSSIENQMKLLDEMGL